MTAVILENITSINYLSMFSKTYNKMKEISVVFCNPYYLITSIKSLLYYV